MDQQVFMGALVPEHPVEKGLAIGVFDLLHVGHLRYFQQASRYCQALWVAVTPDEMVFNFKRRYPVIPYEERLEMVSGIAGVSKAIRHEVSLENTDAALQWIVGLGVQHVFIGDDWAGTARWNRLGLALAAQGIAVSFLPRTASVSSTDIRQRLQGVSG